MKRTVYILFYLFFAMLNIAAKDYSAQDIPMVHLQDARRYVCDPDNILDIAARDSADFYLQKLDKECGIQPVFVIVNNVKDGDVFRVAQDIGNEQGVGDKKTNRGLVVVIAINNRKYFIAPGVGLEKDLTDVESDDIARACIVANMRNGDPNNAVFNTAKTLYRKFKTGKAGLAKTKEAADNSGMGWSFLLLAIIFVLIYAFRKDNGKNNKGGRGNGGNHRDNIFWGPIIWGNPGHINDSGFGSGSFGGGSFGGGSFGGGGAGGSW